MNSEEPFSPGGTAPEQIIRPLFQGRRSSRRGVEGGKIGGRWGPTQKRRAVGLMESRVMRESNESFANRRIGCDRNPLVMIASEPSLARVLVSRRGEESTQLMPSVRLSNSRLRAQRSVFILSLTLSLSLSLPSRSLALLLFRAPIHPRISATLSTAGVALVAAVPSLSVAPRARFAAG